MPEETREKRTQAVYHAALAMGILVTLFGVGVDYILPTASPGVNVVQMLIILMGLALSIGAWQLRRPEVQRKIFGAKSRSLTIGLIITLITLVVLEIVLGVFGMSTYFPPSFPELQVRLGNWTICDKAGCHYDYEKVQAACKNGCISDRSCTVNRQGYADSQDFVAPDEYGDALRVLAQGDSFTFGSSADIGKSYVNFLESRFPESDIWNVGISASGTSQAVAAFKWFAPELQPQLTTLGFFMNDFNDNLLPIDDWLRVVGPEGRQESMRTYQLDIWGNTFAYDPQTVIRYYGHTAGPPRNGLEHAIGITSLGTLTLRLRDALGTLSGALQAKQISVTREYLSELHDLTRAQDSALLVLVVPHREELDAPSTLYQGALELMEELGIP